MSLRDGGSRTRVLSPSNTGFLGEFFVLVLQLVLQKMLLAHCVDSVSLFCL